MDEYNALQLEIKRKKTLKDNNSEDEDIKEEEKHADHEKDKDDKPIP